MYLSIIAALLSGIAPAGALAQSLFEPRGPGVGRDADPVRARLVAADIALTPGEKTLIGLHFEIEPDWYLYWKNPGDAGMPIGFVFEAPDGVRIGDVRWPAPQRHALPGGILDYVHRDAVTLVFPVHVGADLPVGEPVTISARLTWLMCKDEICVPGNANVRIEIPVAAESTETPDAARIARSLLRVPTPASESEFEWAWRERTLTLRVPGADALVFYPGPSERVQPRDMLRAGAVDGDALRISYDTSVDEAEEISAVVEVRREGAPPRFIEIVIPGPDAG